MMDGTNLSVTQPPTKEKMKAKATVMLVMRESHSVASSGLHTALISRREN